ncbi:hypothetical protein [Comamonas terrigena]|uniref:hypothetical protein n=1 Tax=Comamonas terrigena TaxID=32013 RepID=UPI00289AC4D2|nr:hypothetical protein [Comamonas terrigena]
MAVTTDKPQHACIECGHWSLKDTDRSMARLGFARCLKKKLPGHTTSADASACERFAAADAGAVQTRKEWIAKQEGRRT